VDFSVYWLECRARSDRTLLATHNGARARILLPRGATTRLTTDLSRVASQDGDRLFCCRIDWFASEPTKWRAGRMLEPMVSQAMEIFNSQWVPPWESRPLVAGEVFTSNVGVAEYFRLVYGLTRSKWLEDVARLELARTQAATPFMGRTPTAQELVEINARQAFAAFCRISTNTSENVEPVGAANGSQPTGSETNSTSSAAGSRR